MDIKYDVIAVSLGGEPRGVRVLESNKSAANAEAIIKMAVMRRGVDVEFYTTAPHGTYRDGDEYALVDD